MPAISQVKVTPPTPRPGESVKVEVVGADGAPLDAAAVAINGRPGSVRYFQFAQPGTRRLRAVFSGNAGPAEEQAFQIDVAGTPVTFTSSGAAPTTAMLCVRQAQASPYRVAFSLGAPDEATALPGTAAPAAPHVPRGRDAIPHRGGRLARAVDAARGHEEPHVTTQVVARRDGGHAAAIAASAQLHGTDIRSFLQATSTPVPTFEWDFGDGTTATTNGPGVEHDYFATLDHAKVVGTFDVECRISPGNIVVRRTLDLHSAYALCRARGAIVPHVEAETFARKLAPGFTAQMTVHNVEPFELVLDRFAVVALSSTGDAPAVPEFVTMDAPLTIQPQGAAAVGVNVAYSAAVPDNAPGFTVYYAGEASGVPIRLSATFEIPLADQSSQPPSSGPSHEGGQVTHVWPWQEVEQEAQEALLGPLAGVIDRSQVTLDPATRTIAVAVPAGIAASDARVAVDRVLGAASAPAARAPETAGHGVRQGRARRSGHAVGRRRGAMPAPPPPPPGPGPVAEGQICDPTNLSEADLAAADAGQLACQLTTEQQDVLMPARFMNARKGDVILSPGGAGLIGMLLANVDPPQRYSHSGIMTRNYDEVTHSTAAEKRIPDHAGSDGVDANVLKFMWPGVIAQTVHAATVTGEDFTDPNGVTYPISSFDAHAIGVSHNDRFEVVPPLVVKPDPLQETAAVRGTLHSVADEARTGAGRPGVTSKSHYRLFAYTDPASTVFTPAGPDAGWAAGTVGTVCSAFIWSVLHHHGRHLESSSSVVPPADLEPADVAAGAAVDPGTPDGLYWYTTGERTRAAQWLYDEIHNAVYEKAGWFGNLLTDAADDTASQILNAFANDSTDKDSDAWRSPGDARAVSPDNILFWDPPSLQGLYGFSEPLQYREPRSETITVSRWKKVLTRGTLHGTVRKDGAAVSGALVQVYDGKTTFTDADGAYTLSDVPLGSYNLQASKLIDGLFCTASEVLDVGAADVTADLELTPPDERYRLAQLFVDFIGVDDEFLSSNEIDDPPPESYELELGPDRLTNVKNLVYHWGGEVRVECTITFRLLVDYSIDVEIQALLFEGTGEDTTNLRSEQTATFNVPKDQTGFWRLIVDWSGGDSGDISVTVTNARNTN